MAATPIHRETSGSMNAQERAGREFLEQGRFRKARDEFKILCKMDRPKFLPLLVESNIGLAREMHGKGMIAEAQQVLHYLKSIATPDQLLVLELEMGAGSASPGHGPGVPDVLAMLAKPSLTGVDRQNLADRAVLAFEPVPNPGPESAALAQELGAIVSALRAVSERQFDQALELVRPLGQTSVFGHWKMFIKGLGAFYSGDSERAARFFAGLPAASVPAKASQSCQLLLGSLSVSKDAPLPSEAAVEWAGRMAGERGLGAALLRAEQAWRKDDPAQMYQKLREGIPRFPSEGLDLIGVLSEFAVNCSFALPYEAQENYGYLMDDVIEGDIAAKNSVELQMFARATVLISAIPMPDSVVIEFWERFLRAREQLHGSNAPLDSMAYGWLGQLFSKPPAPSAMPFFGFDRSQSRMRNATEAKRLLTKAIFLAEENLSASLSLCQVYQELRRNSDRNKLLDRMTARFPSDKKVLMLAGQACLGRKAYKRGLDYLNQALALDRLDPAIPDALVKAYLLQAREFFQKSRPDDARKALGQTAPFEVPTPGNLTRSRWCLKIQQGLMETTWGTPAMGAALLEEARQASPSEAAFVYYAGWTELEFLPKSARGPIYFDKFERMDKSGATVAQAAVLTQIWLHGRELFAERMGFHPTELLDNYLRAAAKRPFSREDARQMVEFCIAAYEFKGAAAALVEKRLGEDARDPLFRLYRLRLHPWTHPTGPEKTRIELEDILAEATRRKEEQTVRQARQQLDALKNPPPMPKNPSVNELPPEDEFEDDPLLDIGGGIPNLDEMFGGIPPQDKQMMDEFINMIANASDEELKNFKRNLPPGMPDEEFNLLVEMARAKQKFSNKGLLPAPPSRPKKNPRPNLNQQEFF
jgi:tetratricopeptide (TPR) repeat protein